MKSAYTQATSKHARPIKWSQDEIKTNIKKYSELNILWTLTFFLSGLAVYGICVNLLKASYMNEHEALFNEQQRLLLARKAALSLIIAFGSWLVFIVYILKVSSVF